MEINSKQERLSIGKALETGWEITKDNLLLILGLWFVAFVIPSIISSLIQAWVKNSDNAVIILLGLLASIGQFALTALLHTGMARALINLVDGGEARFNDLFSTSSLIVSYAVATILYGLAVAVGMLFLIVPGVIVAIAFGFYVYAMVDHNLGPIQALKRSAAVTKGARLSLFLFGLMLFGLNVAGALCLLVGLVITVPLTVISLVAAYRQLTETAAPLSESIS